MTICERCGSEIPDTVSICPSCGTTIQKIESVPQTQQSETTQETPDPFASAFSRVYVEQTQFSAGQLYRPRPRAIPDPVLPQPTVTRYGNTLPLVIEVAVSLLLGIYGIGWLMIGEVVTGVILVICSLLLYWPFVVISAIFAVITLGLSVFCCGPFIIGALVFNAYMLHKTIARKSALYSHTIGQPK